MPQPIAPITDPPPPEEIQQRLEKVRNLMAREGLDYYVSAHTDNVYYLTNFAYIPMERPFYLVIPAAGRPTLIVPTLEVSHAEDRLLLDVEYQTYYEYPAPAGQTFVDTLRDVIPEGKQVGIESSLSIVQRDVMPGIVKVADIIDEARLVKSDYEIGRIAYACRVTEEGLKKIFELSQPGAQQITLYGDGVRQMMGKTILEID